MTKLSSILATAVVLALCGPDAHAAVAVRNESGNAAGVCQPAFGPSEAALRKRPLSIQNEGTTNAFVTCAFSHAGQPISAYLTVHSLDGVARTVNCTGINGALNAGTVLYAPKSVFVGPGTPSASPEWAPVDFGSGGAYFPRKHVGFSCVLPPGTALSTVGIVYPVDIGT
jgi:hypothetical protein